MLDVEKYHLNVKLEPDAGEIRVSGKIIIRVTESGLSELKFDLHKNFKISEIFVKGNKATHTSDVNEPWMLKPSTKRITIHPPRAFSSEKIELSLNYGGELETLPEFGAHKEGEYALDDQINSNLVELANYSCWYPAFSLGRDSFDIELMVSLPKGWTSICSGHKTGEYVEDGRVITLWKSICDWDMVVVASPKFQREKVETKYGLIDIYHTRLPYNYIRREVREVEDILGFFIEKLGEPSSGVSFSHIYSPKKLGQGGMGFSRPGLVVSSEGRTLKALKEDLDATFYRGLAHEIAHFWWSFGSGQGDWINEAFAEYYSLLAVKEESRKLYEECMDQRRDEVRSLPEDAPSLATVPFSNDRIGYIVRYYKGALMLDHLKELEGEESFFDICREFYKTFHDGSISTNDFRNFWASKMEEHEDKIRLWLDYEDGIPKP